MYSYFLYVILIIKYYKIPCWLEREGKAGLEKRRERVLEPSFLATLSPCLLSDFTISHDNDESMTCNLSLNDEKSPSSFSCCLVSCILFRLL